MVVVFDLPTPTFRMQIWTQYQEKRPEMQSNLAEQIPLVHELLDALGVCYFEVPGYEADDVIGTLSSKTTDNSLQTTAKNAVVSSQKSVDSVAIVTGDRDMLQLINERVCVIVPLKGLTITKTYDADTVMREFGVRPNQWVDVKALKGDSSDNYPGVAGIGPVTAQGLIAKYETLESVYKHLEELQPKLKLKLAEGVEMAGLSQKLARIDCDVPLQFDLRKTEVSKINWKSGAEYMRSVLGFKSIVERVIKTYLKPAGETKETKRQGEQMELI